MTIVAGAVAGILGITGVVGFVVYLISQLLVVPLIVLKAAGDTQKYFPSWCVDRGWIRLRLFVIVGKCGFGGKIAVWRLPRTPQQAAARSSG